MKRICGFNTENIFLKNVERVGHVCASDLGPCFQNN